MSSTSKSGLPPHALKAWEQSPLAELPSSLQDQLLSTAWLDDVPAGQTFYRGAFHTDMAFLGIVVDGLLRTFMHARNGRQVTIRYAGEGALIGVPAIVLEGSDISAEAVFDTRVLRLRPRTFRALAQRDAVLAWTVATFLARQETDVREMLAGAVFMDVRARVARHLLDLSIVEERRFVVLASHQDVADAVGSVREVVSRVVKRLQDDRVLDRVGRRMFILDPARLHAIARGMEE